LMEGYQHYRCPVRMEKVPSFAVFSARGLALPTINQHSRPSTRCRTPRLSVQTV
jgi:hypothetical protein